MIEDLLPGLIIGVIGGVGSGLLGVSSGGFLVALIVLVMGLPQHVAQGVSLVAQVPPTSLSGVMQYHLKGHMADLRSIVALSTGVVSGSIAGALLASGISGVILQWAYVAYLFILGVLSLTRLRDAGKAEMAGKATAPGTSVLLGVGAVGGLSSGMLGIGGGLAITAMLAGALRVPQHVAQGLALTITALPLTLPAALVYARSETEFPWFTIIGIVAGLWIGTLVGAVLATHMHERVLRRLLPAFVFAVVAYMAWRAFSA